MRKTIVSGVIVLVLWSGIACAVDAPELNVQNYSFVPGGSDNAANVSGLMSAIAASGNFGSNTVAFPTIAGQKRTEYYFSDSIHLTRSAKVICSGLGSASDGGVRLVFAPGVDGVIGEAWSTSANAGRFRGELEGCEVYSLGKGTARSIADGNELTNITMYGSETVPSPQTQWAAGDGVIAAYGLPATTATGWGLLTQPGSYIDAYAFDGAKGHYITLHPGFTTAEARTQAAIYRLPAAQGLAFTSTVGSNAIQITGGTRLLTSGDVLWTGAFPFGVAVHTASGPAGSQAITVRCGYASEVCNATKTYAAEEPGKLWVIPAGFKRRDISRTANNTFKAFGIGISMICQSSSSPSILCTSSADIGNTFDGDLVGRWVGGDNSGGSTSEKNFYSHNTLFDILEGGSLGSLYLSDMPHSAEHNTLKVGVAGQCLSQNYSMFIGMYWTSNASNYCLGQTNLLSQPAGVAGTGIPLMLGTFSSTHPLDIPVLWVTRWKNYPLTFANDGKTCIGIGGKTSAMGIGDATCGTANRFEWKWNQTIGALDFNFENLPITVLRFPGRTGTYTGFTSEGYGWGLWPRGFMLGTGVNGQERVIRAQYSGAAPTAWKGDITFNYNPMVGGTVGWQTLSDNTTVRYPFGPISEDTAGTSWKLPQVTHTPGTVAALGACDASKKGKVASVNDGAAGLAWGDTLANGGALYYLVNCNSANWTVIGK